MKAQSAVVLILKRLRRLATDRLGVSFTQNKISSASVKSNVY